MREMRQASLDTVAQIEYGTRVTKKKDGGSAYPVYGGGGATFSLDSWNRENCFIVSRFAMSKECVRYVEGKFFLNDSGLTVSTLDEEVLSQRYLDNFLLARSRQIYGLSRGTAQRNLDMPAFRSLRVPLPPLDEQKRIVAKLDDVTNLAAKASERQKKSVALASQIRKRYLDEAVNNLLEQASLCRLEEVATLIRGPFGGSLKKSMFVDAGFAVYEQKHAIAGDLSGVRYWVDNSKYEEMIRFSIRPGDILMSCSGTIGRVARVQPEDAPGLINQALLLVRPHPIIEPEMLTLLMESEYFQEKVSVGVTGSAMKNVASVRELKKIAIPVPVRSEQLRFIAALADYSSVGSQLHDVAVRRHSLTSSLSARLLESAFAGDF